MRNAEGVMQAIEAKAGAGVRTAAQVLKVALIAGEGGTRREESARSSQRYACHPRDNRETSALMKNELKELQEQLFGAVADVLAPNGFRRTGGRSQMFWRGVVGGEEVVHIAVIEHEDDFDVTVDVAVRFDALEKLVADLELGHGAKIKRYSLGAELGNLRNGRPMRWNVHSERDVADVAEGVGKTVATWGQEYFTSVSNLQDALAIFQSDEREAWLHSPFHVERAKRAVASTFLVLGREAALSVGGKKKEFLESVRDPMRSMFGTFMEAFERETAVE